MIRSSKNQYLSNRELLAEIHKSKKSFAWSADDFSWNFDLILPEEKELYKLRPTRVKEIAKEKSMDKALEDEGPTYTIHDVVVRVMNSDHIPDGTKRRRIANSFTYKVKTNFPPFKHFRIKPEITKFPYEWYECARSHWKGDLEAGEFSSQHGIMSDNLARAFLKLCKRYSTRANWRGYTYVDEMRAQARLQLSQVGLQFDESKSSNPFSYYTQAVTNSFTGILNNEKKHQHIRDDLLEKNGLSPSYTRQLDNAKHLYIEET